MAWALTKLMQLCLMLSIIVCSTPRCGYIIQTLKSLSVSTVEMSCHETSNEKISPELATIDDSRICSCELLSFMVTVPQNPIRSAGERVDLIRTLAPSDFLLVQSHIYLDVIVPPPRFS